MNFPIMNRQPTRTVGIPKLSGGVNLRDSVTLVNDNQLTDCKNMWFKDGVLKTRPGLYTNENMEYSIFSYIESCNGKPLDIYMEKNGLLYRLYQFETVGTEKSTLPDGSSCVVGALHTGVFWVSSINIIPLPEIKDGRISFVTQYKNEIYVYTQNHNIYTMNIDSNSTETQWKKLTVEDFYVPKVAINCQSDALSIDKERQYMGNYGGCLFEGYNLLSPYYRMIYSTVNLDFIDTTNMLSNHPMTYTLIHSVNNSAFAGLKVKAVIKNGENGKERIHEVTLPGNENIAKETSSTDGLYMWVSDFRISFHKSDSQIAMVYENDYFENNLEITAPCLHSNADAEKVFGMRESVWFGSDALGISGGTRLFLCRNNNTSEKNLVLWSALNQPTYFPENCYAYIGNASQSVMAFGRQNDTLVIFKERETFYTKYMRNDNITAEQLINQSVVDYTASSVYFPIVQLHPSIGCDCPNTIQLCRNFLVWASSDGNVYTLRSENQYSERNIYCVSDMVKRSLAKTNLKDAYSADFDGHYFLFADGQAFVMNYESYGYVYSSSYNKTEDAQLMIPWWIWEIPYNPDYLWNKGVFVIGNSLICVFYNADGYIGGFNSYTFNEYQDYDISSFGSKTKIKSLITTKIFDFNSPHTTKNVLITNINFGNNDRNSINLSFVTNRGTEEIKNIYLKSDSTDERSPGYTQNIQLVPSMCFVERFGIKIGCEGKLCIDSISLDYRILGGSK